MVIQPKWSYGDVHKDYPIQLGERWAVGNSEFICVDLNTLDEAPFPSVDYCYVDPPWNQSAMQSYYTKAGRSDKADFKGFIPHLFRLLSAVKYDVFIETGKQQLKFLQAEIQRSGGNTINVWNTTYYETRPCFVVRAYWNEHNLESLDLEGMDDGMTPYAVAQAVAEIDSGSTIYDACTGMGLITAATVVNGLRFVGTELHPYRMAWAIKKAVELTGLPAERVA